MLRSTRECSFVLSPVYLQDDNRRYLPVLDLCVCKVIAKFLALMYSYLKISISKNIVPDGIKGREIHHSFPMTFFQVSLSYLSSFLLCITDFVMSIVLAASCSASGSSNSETFEILDMAICGDQTSVLHLDDSFTDHRFLSFLAELDIHYSSQPLGLSGALFACGFLPCVC